MEVQTAAKYELLDKKNPSSPSALKSSNEAPKRTAAKDKLLDRKVSLASSFWKILNLDSNLTSKVETVPDLPWPSQTSPCVCLVSGSSYEQSPGVGGGARTAWQGDGGSSAGFERYGGSRQCTLPDGEALPAWARSRGGSKAAPDCTAPGREASPREAGFRPCWREAATSSASRTRSPRLTRWRSRASPCKSPVQSRR